MFLHCRNALADERLKVRWMLVYWKCVSGAQIAIVEAKFVHCGHPHALSPSNIAVQHEMESPGDGTPITASTEQ